MTVHLKSGRSEVTVLIPSLHELRVHHTRPRRGLSVRLTRWGDAATGRDRLLKFDANGTVVFVEVPAGRYEASVGRDSLTIDVPCDEVVFER